MDEQVTLGGAWGLAIVMVVIVSWVLYRYVAPKQWREWTGAGLIQAFIIALYAEMYGFPLTIYLLTGFLGLDISWLHLRGHLWATLLGWGDIGAMVEMLLGYILVFFGISLLIEGWRELYNAAKEDTLATDGLYAIVRHPQYTGIFLAVFGQLVHWPTLPTLVLFPVIVYAYYRLALREEGEMVKRFPQAYAAYREAVPALFLPPLGRWRALLRGGMQSADD